MPYAMPTAKPECACEWEKNGHSAVLVAGQVTLMKLDQPVVAIAARDKLGGLVLELEHPFTIPAGTLSVRQVLPVSHTYALPVLPYQGGRESLKEGELYLVRVLTPGNFLKAEYVEVLNG